MEISEQTVCGQRVLLVKESGKVNLGESLGKIGKLAKSIPSEKRLPVLIDALEIEVDFKPSDLLQLVVEFTKFRMAFSMKVAVLKTKDPAQANLKEYFEAALELKMLKFKVFESESAAVEWLSEDKP